MPPIPAVEDAKPAAEDVDWKARLIETPWVYYDDVEWPTETRWVFEPGGTGRVELDVLRSVPSLTELRSGEMAVIGASRMFSFSMKWRLNEDQTVLEIDEIGAVEETGVTMSWDGVSFEEYLKTLKPQPSKKARREMRAQEKDWEGKVAAATISDFSEVFEDPTKSASFFIKGGDGRGIKLLKKGVGTLELTPGRAPLETLGLEGDAALLAWLAEGPLEVVGIDGVVFDQLDVRFELEEGGRGRARMKMDMPGEELIPDKALADIARAITLRSHYAVELEWGVEGREALWLRTVSQDPVLPWTHTLNEVFLDALDSKWREDEKGTRRSLGELANLALSSYRSKEERQPLGFFGRVGLPVRLPLGTFDPAAKSLVVMFEDSEMRLRRARPAE